MLKKYLISVVFFIFTQTIFAQNSAIELSSLNAEEVENKTAEAEENLPNSGKINQTLEDRIHSNLPKLKAYVLLDADKNQVLLEYNSDEKLPPASLTKLMTAYLTFKKIKTNQVSLDTEIQISERALKEEGSKMRLKKGEKVRLEDLLRGTIILSGNDSAYTLAEYLGGGNVEKFVEEMNDTAVRLQMKNTHFVNSNGLPNPEHYSSAKDIALLSAAIVREFPDFYQYYGEKEFMWHGEKRTNRNRLLWKNSQIDGMKTGYTDAAGYCLSASEKRDDSRLVAVVMGAQEEENRYQAAQYLLDEGFEEFQMTTFVKKGEQVGVVQAYKAQQDNIGIVAAEDITIRLNRAIADKSKILLDIPEPIIAPLEKNSKVGSIKISDGVKIYAEVPALTANELAKGGIIKRWRHGLALKKIAKNKNADRVENNNEELENKANNAAEDNNENTDKDIKNAE
ncbi:MAG: D-alanyl-D-alanine carboxypeptidase [Cardiobacteriaceae bacterium]|nr:D-alanyl-D-alanine carboxypeptidase [Cardiobacteriaceae bacterium]